MTDKIEIPRDKLRRNGRLKQDGEHGSLKDIYELLKENVEMFEEIFELEKEYDEEYPATSNYDLHGIYIRVSADLNDIRRYYYQLKRIPYKENIKKCIGMIKSLSNYEKYLLYESSFKDFTEDDYKELERLLDSLMKHS